ncbi:class C sortase [Microbacterium sp. NPDC057944]|uniref:class C sortase n=1 Tax=Microbacterium sp. NPDC057944 TaxID=3346286 RepID=UPI0036DDA187
MNDDVTAETPQTRARPPRSDADARRRPRWRPSVLLLVTLAAAVTGATVFAYAPAAQWLADYNQALIVDGYPQSVAAAVPGPADQRAEAHRYNEALSAGAILAADANVPTSSARTGQEFDYSSMLRTDSGVMSRIQIPSIGVDLPIYHGTDEATLRKGAGHLEGTSLPVGGTSTHAVITAHRGLPEAAMFTDLDRVKKGDLFTLTTFGEVLTYRVIDARVVDPADTETLRQEEGRDLVTLVTCTPLGINSHRILVTGERETPNPPQSVVAAGGLAAGAGFPWWAVAYLAALVVIGVYGWWAGRSTAARSPQADRDAPDAAPME